MYLGLKVGQCTPSSDKLTHNVKEFNTLIFVKDH